MFSNRPDFERYAFTCFEAFGDRVKYWITFNEPRGFSIEGYDLGVQAPGRCSILGHVICKKGKSSTEPYIVAHNILLAHAATYRTYQLNFKVFLKLPTTAWNPVWELDIECLTRFCVVLSVTGFCPLAFFPLPFSRHRGFPGKTRRTNRDGTGFEMVRTDIWLRWGQRCCK